MATFPRIQIFGRARVSIARWNLKEANGKIPVRGTHECDMSYHGRSHKRTETKVFMNHSFPTTVTGSVPDVRKIIDQRQFTALGEDLASEFRVGA